MKVIYKYKIDIRESVKMKLPLFSEILCVKDQNGQACMWVMVDPKYEYSEEVVFRIFGTGHAIEDEGLTYIDTFIIDGGTLVFHVFKQD